MNGEQFWLLIDMIEGDGWRDETTNLDPLIAQLSKGNTDTIKMFFDTLAIKLYQLDTRAHYRRFSWFSGLADTFLYTRLAVIAQGQQFYETVLENPRRFPSRSTKWLQNLLYVADESYENVTGREFDRDSTVNLESFSNAEGWAK